MFRLLSIIISYGSLLLLLMPLSSDGIIWSVLMFLLGAGLIVFLKPNKMISGNRKAYAFMPVSIPVVAYLGYEFYVGWLSEYRIQAIASMLHISTNMLILMCAVILSICSLLFICTSIQIIFPILSDTEAKNYFTRDVVFCLIAAVITVMAAQMMINTLILSMGYLKFFAGILIVLAVILFFYCLLKKCIPAIFLGAGIFMVISTVNVYVYKFRGRLLEPVDVFSAGTAMNVAGNYDLFPIPVRILAGWGVFAAMLIGFCYLKQRGKTDISVKKRAVLLAVCAVCSVATVLYASSLKTYHWDKEGACFNGYILDFVSKFKEISASEPDNYRVELIAELAEKYKADGNGPESKPKDQPHVIVIMDEAFSDLHVAGEFSTNTEITPFISSLKDNTVSGYALASVYGGNTANSEYEFLTGNSMAWLSPNVVPYQQYIREESYSMVSYLKAGFGYKAIAMHPYYSSGWNRPDAYEHLGFDECYFLEDFPQEDFIRDFVSDQEMFEFLIRTYEMQKEEPLFVFGVTMQNHGGYAYSGENFTNHISMNKYGDQFPEVEQYLSLMHETDRAVEYLINYFQDVDDDVIIVFFGDHQPQIESAFYETISGKTADTLDEYQKRYKVPFFIWANYDIDEEYVDCTSLNYLSSYVYDAAGIPLPMYNRFLMEMETMIPSINANGFYSPTEERYLNFDEASEEERLWLEWYEALQYNNMFDKKNQNKDMFPLLK